MVQASMEELVPLFREQLASGGQVRFSPRGRSMLPMLREGPDSVILSPLPLQLRKYDLILYRRENGVYVLHRIIETGDTFTCMGDSQFRPERGLRREQMIAIVTAFTRAGKEYTVTSPCYRLYCRLWHWSRPVRHIWVRAGRFLRRHLT